METNNEKDEKIDNKCSINSPNIKQNEINCVKKDDVNEKSKDDIIIESVLKMNGDIEIFRYFKNKLLGSGGSGKVYEVKCEWSNELYACKVIPIKTEKKKFTIDNIIKEIRMHKYLNHPNIIKYIHQFEDANNIYILTELCKNQTLRQLLKKRGTLTELEIQYYAIQIINAVKYLNDNNILHRDLKLSNIFISDDMQIKIGDFGISTTLIEENKKFDSLCGTTYYLAPEMISNSGLKSQSDIWSFGVILYVLCTNHYPFTGKKIKKIYRSIKRKYYRKPFKFRKVSTELCDLINKILTYNPRERLTWTEILEHDFFKLGESIPKTLPLSTLETPPSIDIIRTYFPQCDETGYVKTNKKFKFYPKGRNIYRDFDDRIKIDKKNKIYVKNDKKYVDQDEEFYYKNHELNQKFINNAEGNKGLKSPETFVKEFKNDTYFHGLAYLLSNGTYGFIYSNKTQLISDSDFKNFFYLERNKEEYLFHYFQKNFIIDNIKENEFKILEMYKVYFDKITKKKVRPLEGLYADEFDEEEDNKIILNNEQKNPPIYVKFYWNLSQSDIFWMSDGTFQTIFRDHTEIILSKEIPTVTFVDKERKRWVYESKNVSTNNKNEEMKKKLQYVSDIIKILQNNN